MYNEPPDQLDQSLQRPFRVCDRCGQLTPRQQPQCVNCGAISIQPSEPEPGIDEQERAHHRFAVAFFSRAAPLSYVLIAVNILIFLAMFLMPNGTSDPAVIIAFGAKTNELLKQGDWYRLVTPIFIHAGFLHLFSNSYALWSVGPHVERLYGSARFLLIYLLAGIGGVIGSFIGQEMMGKGATPSVGASGAIFGLFGVLAIFGYKYRHELPPEFRRAFGSGVFPVIAINLFIGFTIPFIDNGAHIGGLLTGAILTLVVPYVSPGNERISRTGLATLAVCVALIGYCFAAAWRDSGAHLAWRNDRIETYLQSINESRRVMASLLEEKPAGNKDASAKAIGGAIEKLEAASAPDAEADAIRLELLRILRSRRELIGDRRASAVADEKTLEAYLEVNRRLEQWVRTEGGKHGLTLTKEP